jgi:uncharacterized protein (DUF1697 family)
MPTLVKALETCGLSGVETFIASGNFVFSGDASARHIEMGLEAVLGFHSEVFVRSPDELTDLLDICSRLNADRACVSVQVGFMSHPTAPEVVTAFQALTNEMETFEFAHREVIWLAKTKISDTPFGKKGMKGKNLPPMSFRNITTVEKMLDKWGPL